MRQFWEERYFGDYDPKLLSHLSRLLFMKRKLLEPAAAPQPGEEEDYAGASQPGQEKEVGEGSAAFASQEETGRAIFSVLQRRQRFFWSKGIADVRHVLTSDERGELTKAVRQTHSVHSAASDSTCDMHPCCQKPQRRPSPGGTVVLARLM